MNSIHRIGVVVSTVATVATIAGALAVQGYATAEQAAAHSASLVAAVPVQPQVIHVIVPSQDDDGGLDR
jgi:hypothetical protein